MTFKTTIREIIKDNADQLTNEILEAIEAELPKEERININYSISLQRFLEGKNFQLKQIKSKLK